MTATAPGFKAQRVTGVAVQVAMVQRVDVHLVPGNVAERVDVAASLPLIETTETPLGGTIEGRAAAELPVNGGDFTKLLVLVPGAAGDPSGGNDSPGSFGLFSVNGSRGRANNYLLDGTDMNDGYRNLPAINQGGVFGTPATVLPVDALATITRPRRRRGRVRPQLRRDRQHRHQVGHQSTLGQRLRILPR